MTVALPTWDLPLPSSFTVASPVLEFLFSICISSFSVLVYALILEEYVLQYLPEERMQGIQNF